MPGLQRVRHCGIDIRRLAPGDLFEHAAIGRIDTVEGLATQGRHVPPVDEQAGGERQARCGCRPLLAGLG